MTVPDFTANGMLPPGDHEVTFTELRRSVLVRGPNPVTSSTWDGAWREVLVDNLATLTRQLWKVGIRDVFADGSFAEDKDHPNDIDGYFVCDLDALRTGRLVQQLNLLDPDKVWTGTRRRGGHIRVIRSASSRCGTGTESNCTRMCQDSAWEPGSMIGMAMNWSFRRPSDNPVVMVGPGASSN